GFGRCLTKQNGAIKPTVDAGVIGSVHLVQAGSSGRTAARGMSKWASGRVFRDNRWEARRSDALHGRCVGPEWEDNKAPFVGCFYGSVCGPKKSEAQSHTFLPLRHRKDGMKGIIRRMYPPETGFTPLTPHLHRLGTGNGRLPLRRTRTTPPTLHRPPPPTPDIIEGDEFAPKERAIFAVATDVSVVSMWKIAAPLTEASVGPDAGERLYSPVEGGEAPGPPGPRTSRRAVGKGPFALGLAQP
ncbi:hypothetical protein KUCAC02_017339, partial [Chaenocephalus aceratus]